MLVLFKAVGSYNSLLAGFENDACGARRQGLRYISIPLKVLQKGVGIWQLEMVFLLLEGVGNDTFSGRMHWRWCIRHPLKKLLRGMGNRTPDARRLVK